MALSDIGGASDQLIFLTLAQSVLALYPLVIFVRSGVIIARMAR
jgi:hypothetical protein